MPPHQQKLPHHSSFVFISSRNFVAKNLRGENLREKKFICSLLKKNLFFSLNRYSVCKNPNYVLTDVLWLVLLVVVPDGDGEALLGKIRDVCHENKLEKTENNDYS